MSTQITLTEAGESWLLDVTTDPDVTNDPDVVSSNGHPGFQTAEVLRVLHWMTFSELLGWLGFHAGAIEPENTFAPDGSTPIWTHLNPYALASAWDQAMDRDSGLRERVAELCAAKSEA